MNQDLFRQLPSVDAVLGREALSDLPRPLLLRATRRLLQRWRGEIRAGALSVLPDLDSAIREEAKRLGEPRIRRVINATGIVLHTNLGVLLSLHVRLKRSATWLGATAILNWISPQESEEETGQEGRVFGFCWTAKMPWS